jgi:hypothetical protein
MGWEWYEGKTNWGSVAIVEFHLDEKNHWVAELECGHQQHVRHDPPWTERAWVMTEEGRREHLGHELVCLLCGES